MNLRRNGGNKNGAVNFLQPHFLFSGISFIEVHDIEILRHIKAVGAATAVDLMAAMIHGKAHQRIMGRPMGFNQLGKDAEDMAVFIECGKGEGCLRAVFMHYCIIVAIINADKIVFIFYDQLCCLCIDLFLGMEDEIIHFPL